MSTGYNNKFDEENGTIHCSHYDDFGRNSMDYDPLTGDTTKDNFVSNENKDYKKQWDESNIGDDVMSIKSLRNRSLLMLLILSGLSLVLFNLFSICSDLMQLEWNDDYGDYMYSSTNFNSMEFCSGISITIILIAGYLMFKKSQFCLLFCLFWFLILCVLDYAISQQFTIYNFQLSTAVSNAFDRRISPILVVLCGVAYAVPIFVSIRASLKIKENSRVARIFLRMLVLYFGMGISCLINMIVYFIGILFFDL